VIRGVAVLGSTGSIGTTALRVLDRHRERFEVVALTAYDNGPLLAEQASQWSPSYVGLVRNGAESHRGWRTGEKCLVEAAQCADAAIVLNAVVGSVGLDATLAALRAGKRVALANKETLVLGGELVMQACRASGGELVPVDSEHSAILQCLAGRDRGDVRRVVLTASGGPFRGRARSELAGVTVEDALRHPTWRMGRKITVDSATLANKALEVIEAHYLFDLPYESIEVVVHPQSVVHSFVEFVDGSVMAQLGVPSMELPVLYSLTHPERLEDAAMPAFDPVSVSPLTFEPVARDEFPALKLGYAAGRAGGACPAVFNAANEQAVTQFLAGRITFTGIADSISSALEALSALPGGSREELLAADRAAREHVERLAIRG
jgi:1-deoxy-D-xylulose-5-phosphate reductoisomerase